MIERQLMKNRFEWNICILLIPALCLIISGCGNAEAERSVDVLDQGVLIQGSARLVNIETQILRLQTFREVINLTGVAVANQDVTISAQESGVIREIALEKGSLVQEGQELFKIDEILYVRGQEDSRLTAMTCRVRFFGSQGMGLGV